MKRELIAILAGLVIAATALAELHPLTISIANIPTNATAQASGSVTNSDVYVTGWIDTIILDFGGYASPTADVDIVTAGSEGIGPSRTLFTKDSLTADGIYPVRDLGTTTAGADITGAAVKIPLVNERIGVNVYESGVTNTTSLTVYILYSDEP